MSEFDYIKDISLISTVPKTSTIKKPTCPLCTDSGVMWTWVPEHKNYEYVTCVNSGNAKYRHKYNEY